jgi:hypothetical protein
VQLVFLVFLLLWLCIVHSMHVALYCLLHGLYIRIFHIPLVLFLFVLVLVVSIHQFFHTEFSVRIPVCDTLLVHRMVLVVVCVGILLVLLFSYPFIDNFTSLFVLFQSKLIPMYLDPVQSVFTG